ncbi:hypothetical protein ABGB07_13590 [Micromonosporaceae bacterium B7E4]
MLNGESRPRPRRRTPLVGLAVVLAVTLGGCARDEEGPGVATVAGPGVTASASAAAGLVAEYVAERRNYARCLREQGFDVPDPDPKGQLDLSAVGGRGKTDPKVRAALEACKEFSTIPVPAELEDRGPAPSAAEIAHRREYAKCMRANGVPGFQDPGSDGRWPDSAGPGQTEQQAAAQFRAGQICEPVLDGKPPTTPNPNATGLG